MKILSIDCETNGLWGEIIAIGAAAGDIVPGERPLRFFGGKITMPTNLDPWVKENIAPQLGGLPEYGSYAELLTGFAKFYREEKKEETHVICHMGYIVEARLLRDLHEHKLIENFEGPYPLYDISTALRLVGKNPTSVDKYAEEYQLPAKCINQGVHNPIYDAEICLYVYRHIFTAVYKLRLEAGSWRSGEGERRRKREEKKKKEKEEKIRKASLKNDEWMDGRNLTSGRTL